MSNCPFISGKTYQVQVNIDELGHAFTAGEIVVFQKSAYDPHNGVTRFWFTKRGGDQMRVWHVWDTDPPADEQWKKCFHEHEGDSMT